MGCISSKQSASIHDESMIDNKTISVSPTNRSIRPSKIEITPLDTTGLHKPRQPSNSKSLPHTPNSYHTHRTSNTSDLLSLSIKPKKSILRHTESGVTQHIRQQSNKSISKNTNEPLPTQTVQHTSTISTDSLALPPNSVHTSALANQIDTTTVRSFKAKRRNGRAKSVDATQFYAQQLSANNQHASSTTLHSTNISFDANNNRSTLPAGISSHRIIRHSARHNKDSTHGQHTNISKPGSRRNSKLVRHTSFRGLMNQLALKFPVIRASFNSVHQVFRQYHLERQQLELVHNNNDNNVSVQHNKHNNTNTSTNQSFNAEAIRYDQLQRVLQDITQYKHIWSDSEVYELFTIADLDHSHTISFREFLIIIAVGYFLKVQSDDTGFTRIQSGFNIIKNAFDSMDTNHSGTIDLNELKSALFNTVQQNNDNNINRFNNNNNTLDSTIKSAAGMSSTNAHVLEQRFAELDFNSDKSIEFPEFLFCIYSWVGFDDEENNLSLDNIDNTIQTTDSTKQPSRQLSQRTSYSHKL